MVEYHLNTSNTIWNRFWYLCCSHCVSRDFAPLTKSKHTSVDDINNRDSSIHRAPCYLIHQEPMLYERFVFVFTKMTDYSSLQLVMEDFAGYQSQWGCKSWTLWVTYTPDILATLLEWDVHNLLFDYINYQALNVSGSKQKAVVLGTPPSAVS